MSDRAKIRNRRVSGNDVQQQREVANAIKIAREMALLPYARRVSTQRTRPPRDGGRDGRDEGRPPREGDAEAPELDDRGAETVDERDDETSRGRELMKMILRSDLDGLGKRGDIVDVADGYGRNYLLPAGLALKATDGAVDQAAKMRRARDLRDASDREAAQTIATTLVPKIITITAKSGSEGKLFGSVTVADVVDAVARADRRRARSPAADERPIKTLGQHTADGQAAQRRVVPHHRRDRLGADHRWGVAMSTPHPHAPAAGLSPTSAAARPLAPHTITLRGCG